MNGKSIDHCQSTRLRQYSNINRMRTKRRGTFLLVNDVISTLDSIITLKKENKTIKSGNKASNTIPTFTRAYVLLLLPDVMFSTDNVPL